ncbi:hypothetical protein DAPPUDRAFT_300238 [Daphnia pulex]|uniref:Epidermal cell-derived protein n=1 Tax=Daphnia pulex TaxID=6669 RepID=E9G5K2_DAPPU|nr:hypothetical protein DAPPUDRAFT_300238 [Daphnia pulex]|eukprot:EFX85615.1 hypothetical protein DAPPUDRAFT_300238 [Daphnia pulex]
MAKFTIFVILVSFAAVAMANGYNGKPYEQPVPYGSSYAPEKKHYESPSYNMKPKAYETSYERKHYETPSYDMKPKGYHQAPAYNTKAYNPPQPSYQMKAKAYNPQPSYVQSKGYDSNYEKPKSYGSHSAY